MKNKKIGKNFFLVTLLVLLVLAVNFQVKKETSAITTSGDRRETFLSSNSEKSYLLHLPQNYSPAKTWPLILALHSESSNAKTMSEVTGLSKTADSKGFIVVYPEASNSMGRTRLSGTWNPEKEDDVKLIKNLITELEKKYSINRRRIYVTGFGAGAKMTYELACELSGKIAAFAPVSGTLNLNDLKNCKPARKAPIIHLHGVADSCVPYQGGNCKNCSSYLSQLSNLALSLTPKRNPSCPSVPEYFSEWLKINRLPQEPLRVDNEGMLTCQYYGWRRDSYDMELCTLDEAGHTWPGGTYGSVCRNLLSPDCALAKSSLGKIEAGVSANNLIWDFLQKHSLP